MAVIAICFFWLFLEIVLARWCYAHGPYVNCSIVSQTINIRYSLCSPNVIIAITGVDLIGGGPTIENAPLGPCVHATTYAECVHFCGDESPDTIPVVNGNYVVEESYANYGGGMGNPNSTGACYHCFEFDDDNDGWDQCADCDDSNATLTTQCMSDKQQGCP